MKNITTKINGQTVSIEFDHHYSNIYCVDIYINGTFQVNNNLDKKTKLAITKWCLLQIREVVAQGNCLCASAHNSDGQGEARTKMFIKAGFVKKGPLMYLG